MLLTLKNLFPHYKAWYMLLLHLDLAGLSVTCPSAIRLATSFHATGIASPTTASQTCGSNRAGDVRTADVCIMWHHKASGSWQLGH